jgi:phosphatidyl-myo-inositol alpha-mannosyltransferase
MKKLRVGLVCPYDITRGGGVQEHVMAQRDELVKRGHKVLILTPRPRKFSGEIDGVEFIGRSAKFNLPVGTTLEMGGTLSSEDMSDRLKALSLDIIHVHEPEIPFIGGQVLRDSPVPTLATFHGTNPDSPMGRTINRFRGTYGRSIFPYIDYATAVSEPPAQFLKSQLEDAEVDIKLDIVPNGIELMKYGSARSRKSGLVDPDSPHIVYVGRLEKRKGVKFLVQAFADAQRVITGARLTLVGDGPLRQNLEDMVDELNCKNVTFEGFVPDARKIELLTTCDIYCSPAVFGESFGIVLLEAMAAGAVILAGNNPGYSSVMTGFGRLSLVNPYDTESFTTQLLTLIQEPDLRNMLRKWSDEYVEQFDYSKIVDRYEGIYKKLLASKG